MDLSLEKSPYFYIYFIITLVFMYNKTQSQKKNTHKNLHATYFSFQTHTNIHCDDLQPIS